MNPPPAPVPVPLSPDDVELLKKYRDIVMPANRLAGYDDFAKWLFTVVAVIGTLGAAFSNAAFKGLSGKGSTAFLLAIVATGMTLALAVIQRSVDVSKLNYQSLSDILEKTEDALRIKRALAWLAGTLFAIAILLAGLAPLLSPRNVDRQPGNSFTYLYGKDGIHTIATFARPTGIESEIEVAAQSDSSGTIIGAQRASADSNGVVKFDLTSTSVPPNSGSIVITVRCDVRSGQRHSLVIALQKLTQNPTGQDVKGSPEADLVNCQ